MLLLCLFAGFILIVILAALYSLLDNQQSVLEQNEECRRQIIELKRQITGNKVCSRCEKEVDTGLSSCPYCGSREFSDDTKPVK